MAPIPLSMRRSGAPTINRKSDFAFLPRPVGQITCPQRSRPPRLSSPSRKNISVFQKRKSPYMIPIPPRQRGVS
jgi:hypothetical protein